MMRCELDVIARRETALATARFQHICKHSRRSDEQVDDELRDHIALVQVYDVLHYSRIAQRKYYQDVFHVGIEIQDLIDSTQAAIVVHKLRRTVQ